MNSIDKDLISYEDFPISMRNFQFQMKFSFFLNGADERVGGTFYMLF